MKYLLGIDQSTQGTKCILYSETGAIVCRHDISHEQIVNQDGWVSHNLNEIFDNVISVVKACITKSKVNPEDIVCCGISNQRETTGVWDTDGNPLENAVVWQCNRAQYIADQRSEFSDTIYKKTGLPLSPYFPASKMTWLLEHISGKENICIGTIDSWIVFKLTNGENFYTDYSNASRTQLFNIQTLSWDDELCDIFGVKREMLPEVRDSNSCFGYSDFDNALPRKIPIHAVMGDSHSALYGQGCHEKGMAKATYGTGSSIMMNIGENYVHSEHTLSTSLAWSENGKVSYVLEGNVIYAGAVITWLIDDVGIIDSPKETDVLAREASPEDTTVLIPAFSGLGAPYWNKTAKAKLCGMSRTTKKAEIVRASLESIGFQINAVIDAMNKDCKDTLKELRVDGGPTKNKYLMQFQSDVSNINVRASKQEELSAIGVVIMAGLAYGIFEDKSVFDKIQYTNFEPKISSDERKKRINKWDDAIKNS